MMGKPLTLTPDKQEKILQAIRAGNYRSAASKFAGVDWGCMRNWIRKGNKGEEPYAAFVAAVKEAEGQAEASLVASIKKASQEHWTAAAWLLERKHAPKWGRRDMSWENMKREKREAQQAQLAEIPLEELERMVVAEKARRAQEAAAKASDVGALQ
jgi:hypothetical protein